MAKDARVSFKLEEESKLLYPFCLPYKTGRRFCCLYFICCKRKPLVIKGLQKTAIMFYRGKVILLFHISQKYTDFLKNI